MFKKSLIITAIIILTSLSALSAQNKEPVAVLDFTGHGVSQSEASAISSMFTVELVRSGLFEVMDRKNINEILAEHKLQLSGCTDTSCAVEIGQILSLQYIFSGEVSKLGKSYIASINYINVETSKIERSTTQKFNEIGEAYDVLPAAIAELTGEADYSRPVYQPQKTDWWGDMSKSQQAGFITMVSGLGAAAIGGGLLVAANVYHKNEVLPLYETYQKTGGGYDKYSEKGLIKNIMLISSLGMLGGGIITAVTGTVLWLKDTPENSGTELGFNLLPNTAGAVTLKFDLRI